MIDYSQPDTTHEGNPSAVHVVINYKCPTARCSGASNGSESLPQDVRVPQVALDFDFADDLMLHTMFPQLCFMEDFQPKDISTKPVTGEVDVSCGTLRNVAWAR